jgi:hypothetical protein
LGRWDKHEFCASRFFSIPLTLDRAVGLDPINSGLIICGYIYTIKNRFLIKNSGSKSLSLAVGLSKCPTGINGLDEITGGGLPRKRPTLVWFDPDHHPAKQNGKGDFRLLSMRERATYLGDTIKVKSGARIGREIEVSIPLPPSAIAAG